MVAPNATATQVQYIVPSVTPDGKLVLPNAGGSMAGAQTVRVLTSGAPSDVGGVIKPLGATTVLNNKHGPNLLLLNTSASAGRPVVTAAVSSGGGQSRGHKMPHGE